jgi:hypothetical protein
MTIRESGVADLYHDKNPRKKPKGTIDKMRTGKNLNKNQVVYE